MIDIPASPLTTDYSRAWRFPRSELHAPAPPGSVAATRPCTFCHDSGLRGVARDVAKKWYPLFCECPSGRAKLHFYDNGGHQSVLDEIVANWTEAPDAR